MRRELSPLPATHSAPVVTKTPAQYGTLWFDALPHSNVALIPLPYSVGI
jgi:hypothetical protein